MFFNFAQQVYKRTSHQNRYNTNVLEKVLSLRKISLRMAHPTRLFNKPEELKAVFEAYKEDVKEQSKEWLRIMYVGKDAERKEEGQKVPYTFEGFKRFVRKSHGEVEQYFLNTGGYYNDFVGICRAIKEEIRENQIIGGMLNFYNPSITQRLNNLSDNIDHTTGGDKITSITREIVKPEN